jgi:hypothetical protein
VRPRPIRDLLRITAVQRYLCITVQCSSGCWLMLAHAVPILVRSQSSSGTPDDVLLASPLACASLPWLLLLLLLPRPCRKGLKLDGSNSTLLYGYGEDSALHPSLLFVLQLCFGPHSNRNRQCAELHCKRFNAIRHSCIWCCAVLLCQVASTSLLSLASVPAAWHGWPGTTECMHRCGRTSIPNMLGGHNECGNLCVLCAETTGCMHGCGPCAHTSVAL